MKRVAIFAHYDKNNIIDDYVVFYLKKLKEVVDSIIFVSDSKIKQEELDKINNLILDSICQKHGEYDFGSYKRGFFFLKEKYENEFNTIDELVLANDSCYCIGDFTQVFQKMSYSDCDFWGITQNKDQYPEHIQSYFIVFKKKIIISTYLTNFIKNIKKEKSKQDIIENYEVGLTQFLLKNGFKKTSFIEKIYKKNSTISNLLFKELIPKKVPLIKVQLVTKNPYIIFFLNKKIKSITTKEVFFLIKNHKNRVSNFLSRKQSIIRFITKCFFTKKRKNNKLLIKVFKIPVYKSGFIKIIVKKTKKIFY
jgi:lipopolysaccharide biosynthesis protein